MAVLAVSAAEPPKDRISSNAESSEKQRSPRSARLQPAGPPPPAAALARLESRRIPASLLRLESLHELHPELCNLAAPVRDGLIPLTIVSAGFCRAGRQLPIFQLSPELRGLFSAWLRSLIGDDDGWNSGRLSVEMWVAQCSDGAFQPFRDDNEQDANRDSWPAHSISRNGVVAGVPRYQLSSAHDGVELLDKALSGCSSANFVVVGLELRRYVPELGCTALTSAYWIDVASDEVVRQGDGIQSLAWFLAHGAADMNAGLEGCNRGRPDLRGHPLLALLGPALRGERALALIVVGPREVDGQDPATKSATELATSLIDYVPSAAPSRQIETTSVREGFAKASSSTASAIESFGTFAGSLRELRDPITSPMKELLRGDISIRTCGFPSHALPSLNPYMSRFMVTAIDRKVLIAAAEAEISDFEDNGWFVARADVTDNSETSLPWSVARPVGISDSRVPAPLYVHLADCYCLPPDKLSTTVARSYCRLQNAGDPMVRTIRRIREDVTLAVALLPLCASHPFNPVRLLRLGGIHSLLALLSDASALAPGHADGLTTPAPAVDALVPAELGALTLTALAVFAPIRAFLISQNILELLAVAIRHPASDRHLLFFAALLIRLCFDPEHRQLAANIVSPSLAEQIPKLHARGSSANVLLEALLAATANLSPFLPASVFAPVLHTLLGHLSASAAPAFHSFACALASSLQRSGDLDLGSFVPRLLSLVPIQAPTVASFHSGAAALLALCSHTASTTSLSRRWVVAAATAVVRHALRSGPSGLSGIHTVIPLAAAQVEAGDKKAEKDRGNEYYAEVEETISLQATFRWTQSGFFSGGLGGTLGTLGTGTLGASLRPPPTPQVPLREQRLHGWTHLMPIAEIAESPNTALFHEGSQIRIVIPDARERTEVFISSALLPTTHCENPCSACGCSWSGEGEGCGGQLGLWICPLPDESLCDNEVRCWRHQLDLRPPVHASAADPGQVEHFISLTLPHGAYTLIPFSSHVVSANAASIVRSRCRASGCGCSDVNLMQESLWDRSSRNIAISVWAECTQLEVNRVLPNYLRLAVSGELLLQSVPLWLQIPESCERSEVLLCLCGDGAEASSLRGTDPCLDLFPNVVHRRVRNERTGALRIHIPVLQPDQPLRITCLWQGSVDPTKWSRPAPRLFVYSSSPASLSTPPPCQIYPALQCKSPVDQAGRWQAAMLLSGAWTPGFSSGFGNLRNPQVILEVPRSPGRAEELQLVFYLSIPSHVVDKDKREQDRKNLSPALTVFSRQEPQSRSPGPPDRLFEGQLRKELGASKASIGGYVTAQVVVSGAEARQPLYVVLQNSEPNESFPWQLRILARIRPCSTAENGKTILPIISATDAETFENNDRPFYEAEVPDEPPIRCAIVGGTAEVNHIYACWPDNLALYVPKPNRGEILGNSERVVSWIPSRRAWGKDELVKIESSLGPHPLPGSPLWPPAEPLIFPDDDARTCAIAVAAPNLMLASPPKAPSASDRTVLQAHAIVDPVEHSSNEQLAPLPSSRRFPPKMPQTSETITPPNPAQLCGVVSPPAVSQQEPRGARARAVESVVRGKSKERLESVVSGTSKDRQRPQEHLSENIEPTSSKDVSDTQATKAHSERHARVEALMRRRRQGHGSSSSPRDESSSQPPPRVRGSGRRSTDEESSDRGKRQYPSHRGDLVNTVEPSERGGDSAGISLPHPPLTTASPRGISAIRESRYRIPTSSFSQDSLENRGGPATPRGASSLVRDSGTVSLPKLKTSRSQADDSSIVGIGEKSLRCCHFAGHPVFCCQAETQRSKGPTRHIVKLERRPGADRLGFGNVAAGPKEAPVLVISWVRDGALAAWNDEAPEGLRVPPQSAIVSVNGVSADVQAMREQLRAPTVEMEVIAPDRWRWNDVVNAS